TSKRRASFVKLGNCAVDMLNEEGFNTLLPSDTAEILWGLAELGVAGSLKVPINLTVDDIEEVIT
ncbi:hypothetical protein TL16_g13346, partial [Triparma laevis f. inornata]